MMQWVNLLGWLGCAVYSTIPCFWLLIHPWASQWRARRQSPYFVLLPVWIAMWVVFGRITWPWREVQFYSTPWAWIPAMVLFVIGLWLYRQSAKGFSARQLGGLPELHAANPEQRLVTTGIRSRARHPVYLAHVCEMIAWSVGTGLTVCYALTAFAVVTGAVMIRMEDNELEQRFGAEYAAYRKQVPALLPKLGRG
jgi:protein-S-isoprenylcysteine O-methyltransferase Ste14